MAGAEIKYEGKTNKPTLSLSNRQRVGSFQRLHFSSTKKKPVDETNLKLLSEVPDREAVQLEFPQLQSKTLGYPEQ